MIDTSIDVDDDRHLSGRNERPGALKNEHTRTEVVGGNRMGKKSESIAEKAMKFGGKLVSQIRQYACAKTNRKKRLKKLLLQKKARQRSDPPGS